MRSGLSVETPAERWSNYDVPMFYPSEIRVPVDAWVTAVVLDWSYPDL